MRFPEALGRQFGDFEPVSLESTPFACFVPLSSCSLLIVLPLEASSGALLLTRP